MKDKMKRFLVINLGILVMAIGLYFFLVPANLAVGGATGIALVIQYYLPDVNIGILMAIINVFLFILAFIFIGKDFGGYTVYSSFTLAVVMGLFGWICPMEKPFVDDLMITLIFGIVIQGIGMALVFYENASTGGTDIVAKIMTKYTKIEIGKALFLSDSMITVMAGILFGPTLGFYAFLGILINGLLIDKVIAGFENKIHAMIISEAHELIVDYIQDDLNRGTTLIEGTGGYTMLDKKIINVILSRKEYIALKKYIRQVDPKAFITVNFVHEVIGEGFETVNS